MEWNQSKKGHLQEMKTQKCAVLNKYVDYIESKQKTRLGGLFYVGLVLFQLFLPNLWPFTSYQLPGNSFAKNLPYFQKYILVL